MSSDQTIDVPEERPGFGRRRFLQLSGTAAAAAGMLGTGLLDPTRALAAEPSGPQSPLSRQLEPTVGQGATPRFGRPRPGAVGQELTAVPIRPPAVPLIVRQPYVSTWLQATALPGTWQTFWAGQITAMGGFVIIDGAPYMIMGSPGLVLNVPNGNYGPQTTTFGFEAALSQTLLEVTPTRSTFTLQGGGIQVVIDFLSPVEPGDLRRQSVPFGYVKVTTSSIDGAAHAVKVYLDISGEWLSGDRGQQFTWAPSVVPYSGGSLQTWALQLANPTPLSEINNQAEWGTTIWSTPVTPGLTWQSGPANDVRAQFMANGALGNTNDTNYTAINDNYPVFAFAVDLGQVGGRPQSLLYTLGQVRTPAISFLGTDLAPLWSTYWSDWQSMLGDVVADAPAAWQRAEALDNSITGQATAVGGQDYAALCALSLRQAYAGTELVVGPDGSPWAFLKEISSDGDTSTVDVLFPASPVWVYLDPTYLSLLLDPLFAYAEGGGWTAPFAEHDLGPYPTATGYPGNGGENMPVEETANMIIMAAAFAQGAPGASTTAYLKKHYPTLTSWATYLTQNLPDPGFQNQTDDFAGPIAHSVNLAIKGIVAVAAMAQIATVVGDQASAAAYRADAQGFVKTWLTDAQDPSGTHLDLTYNGSGGGNGTWGTVYNAYADDLLGTGLIPESVKAEQAAWYASVSNLFGVPLQIPHSYAKTDWQMWVAAWLRDYPIKGELIAREYLYANTTPSRVPFSDLYDTISGDQVGFQARPVQGGIFALLALQALEDKRGGPRQ
jgi:hypothetical protein